MPSSARRRLALLAAAVLLLGGCESVREAPRESARTDPPEAAPAPPAPSERLGLATGWGPDADLLDRAARRVRRMRLGDLAGQVIVAAYPGTAAPVGLVRRLHLGGVIAFSGNVESTTGLRRANRTLHRSVRRPLLVGVDQEGGIVERVKGELTRLPAFMTAGAAGDARLTRRAYGAAAAELRGLGFTMNFAPDADVTLGPADPVIGSRSASATPAVVATQAVAAARGHLDAGVLPVVKHFPGHGSVTADSHRVLPVQPRSLARLRRTDLVPFRAAVAAGLPAMMVGHLAVPAVDPGTPATLSRPVVTGLLREDLGFDGLVVTDALEMGAVTNRYGAESAAVRTLRAGADVLLVPPDPAVARAGIVRAVRDGRLPRRRLEQAAARTLALAWHQQAMPGRGATPGSAASAARRLSEAAVTVVAGRCGGRLAGDELVPFGDPVAVANFRAAALRAGLPLGRVVTVPRPPRRVVSLERIRTGPRKGRRRKVVELVPRPPRVVVEGTRIDLVGYGGGTPTGPVVVATDTPYVLGRSDAPVRLASYGTTPEAMSSVVAVLLGRERAPGRLPVPVPGVPRRGC